MLVEMFPRLTLNRDSVLHVMGCIEVHHAVL
jgi:hypothetical protein